MTYRSMVTEGGRVLAAAGVPEAELDAWYLLEYLRKEWREYRDTIDDIVEGRLRK